MKISDRNRDLAAIHVAKKALSLPEDEYRDLMATVCAGVRSSALLDQTGRKRFLAHLQACQAGHGMQARVPSIRPDRKPLKPYEKKLWALWMQLADAGLVESRTMRALNAFSKRQTQVDSITFLNRHQQDLVIESLKRWLSRSEVPA